MTIAPSIFGRGFAFPFQLDSTNLRPVFDTDEDRVKGSINAIISTDISERPMRIRNGVPYGTRIPRMCFENSLIALDVAPYDARRSLTVWEPRIVVLDVGAVIVPANQSGRNVNTLRVTVSFAYRATNRPDSFVVPFRLAAVSDDVTGASS